MKLQSQVSREYKGKKYYKHWVNLPSKAIQELDWEKGDNLDYKVEDDKITIKKDT